MSDFSKVLYAFNKFFGVFLREVKELNDDLHTKVKTNYKVIDKTSSTYLEDFWTSVGEKLSKKEITLDAPDEVLKAISLKDLSDAYGADKHSNLVNQVYTLLVFAFLFKNSPTDEALFEKSLKIIDAQQKGNKSEFDEELEDVMDDDLKSIFASLVFSEDSTAEGISDATANLFEKFGDSKICQIAKEVSEKIDLSKMKVESPEDIMKMMDFSKGGNNILGDIVSQVTSTISSKMSSGELKQDDLIKEAMSMMGSLGGGAQGMGGGGGLGGMAGLFNNPMFASMMKNMAGMQGGGGKTKVGVNTSALSKMATRDKLRKKLEARKAAESAEN